jgi:hypothetical protein
VGRLQRELAEEFVEYDLMKVSTKDVGIFRQLAAFQVLMLVFALCLENSNFAFGAPVLNGPEYQEVCYSQYLLFEESVTDLQMSVSQSPKWSEFLVKDTSGISSDNFNQTVTRPLMVERNYLDLTGWGWVFLVIHSFELLGFILYKRANLMNIADTVEFAEHEESTDHEYLADPDPCCKTKNCGCLCFCFGEKNRCCGSTEQYVIRKWYWLLLVIRMLPMIPSFFYLKHYTSACEPFIGLFLYVDFILIITV